MNLHEAAGHKVFNGKIGWKTPLDAALTYAARGWWVFPCHSVSRNGQCSCGNPQCTSPGKHPRTPKGVLDASANPVMLRSWFTNLMNANTGLRCGPGYGPLVIDIDPDKGGQESLAGLSLPETLTSLTGGGGRHLFFQTDEAFTSTVGVLPGIDIRSSNSYVILPPSNHISGNSYQWQHYGMPIAELPDSLRALLRKPPKKQAPSNGTGAAAAKKIPEGKRNDHASKRAYAMRRTGFSGQAIFDALVRDNATFYDPPMAEEELRRVAFGKERIEPEPESEEPPGRLRITELSNAERLLEKYDADLRFTADRQVWVTWSDGLWRIGDAGPLRMMGDVCRNIYFEAGAQPTQDLREAFASWAKKSEACHIQTNSLAMARIDLRVEVGRFSDVFDRHPMLLNSPNGVIDCETGELLPHNRALYLTKMVPIAYDSKAECPRFLKFLETTFQDSKVRDYIQHFAWLCTTGKTSNQSWWMFYGETAGGKSILLNILRGILGPYAIALPENYFLIQKNTTDFITANLQGVRLATCVETAETRTLDVPRIKTLTGEDTVSAALKYQNYFEFRPEAKLVLATNHRPRVPATDDSIWRRVKVVGFTHTVPFNDRVEGLAEKLIRDEGSGILGWAIRGRLTGKLVEPEAVRREVAEYRCAEDVVSNFLEAECELDPDARTSRTELSRKFSGWCRDEGFRQMSGKRFVSELARLGILPDSRDEKHFFAGIRLRGNL